MKTTWSNGIRLIFAILMVMAMPIATPACEAGQEMFSSPQGAVRALVAASRNGDRHRLLKILGLRAEKLISSGDPVADKKNRERFVAAYDTWRALEMECQSKMMLLVGKNEWPMPIPLVKDESGWWWFDTAAGEDEILNRRIGRNELDVIRISHVYVEAQREYALGHPLFNGHPEYAQHFLSRNGKHDGLYWPAAAGEKESPMGPLIANAQAEGYLSDTGRGSHKCQPFHGYYYRILKSQGRHAPGGAKDYVKSDHMTGGFALIAFPARYGDSGIMTFIVNQNGTVYEKNLGPETARIAPGISRYDPDKSWEPAKTSEY